MWPSHYSGGLHRRNIVPCGMCGTNDICGINGTRDINVCDSYCDVLVM